MVKWPKEKTGELMRLSDSNACGGEYVLQLLQKMSCNADLVYSPAVERAAAFRRSSNGSVKRTPRRKKIAHGWYGEEGVSP